MLSKILVSFKVLNIIAPTTHNWQKNIDFFVKKVWYSIFNIQEFEN
jgi:hypothetical protein